MNFRKCCRHALCHMGIPWPSLIPAGVGGHLRQVLSWRGWCSPRPPEAASAAQKCGRESRTPREQTSGMEGRNQGPAPMAHFQKSVRGHFCLLPEYLGASGPHTTPSSLLSKAHLHLSSSPLSPAPGVSAKSSPRALLFKRPPSQDRGSSQSGYVPSWASYGCVMCAKVENRSKMACLHS
jgi:hypothetical protein